MDWCTCRYYPELVPPSVVKVSCRLLVTLETGITFFSLGENKGNRGNQFFNIIFLLFCFLFESRPHKLQMLLGLIAPKPGLILK